jgi:RNA polymerase sigma factor (TIGR02999 family)
MPDKDELVGLGEGETGLVSVVYDELRILASAYLRKERPGHTLQTTALVHEAWMRLSSRDAAAWNDRAHYLRAAALAMRRILVNHAEKHRAQKRGHGDRVLSLNESIDAPVGGEIDILALNEALNRLAETDAQKAKVVDLKFFGGCTIDETAEALGISSATVEREWRFARAWLRVELDDTVI